MIIKTNLDEFNEYLTDASCFTGYSESLYIPESKGEIVELFKRANSEGFSITISGAGTGLTGSRVPLGSIILSMEKFNSIKSLAKNEKMLEVESFVRLTEIQDYLEGSGLFYPPNPTEKLATIGGNIGNNASGSRTYKYGATRKYIDFLEIILPSGDTLDLRRGEIFANGWHFDFCSNEGNRIKFDLPEISMPSVKHSAGYFIEKNMDLIDLFIGAEGTLGLIVSARLKLLPAPQEVLGAIIFFDEHNKMYDFLNYVKSIEAAISPRLIEFFDDNSLELLRPAISQIPSKAVYALWIEVESDGEKADSDLESIYQVAQKFTNLADETWLAQSNSEHKRLAEFRHALPLAVYEKIQQYKQQKLGTDTAVPDASLKAYHEEMISLFKFNELEYVIWGHIGNSHFHANIITKTNEEFENAKNIFNKIVARAVALGGTVSAEHGIGKIKKDYLKMLYNNGVINSFRQIKIAFDRNSVLNIGNIF